MTADPHQSAPSGPGPTASRDLLHAEWTKFRTVRGWVIAMVVAALVIVALGARRQASRDPACNGPASAAPCRLGPGGEAVTDSFYFVHRPLTGNGSITVRVTSLTGQIPDLAGGGRQAEPRGRARGPRPGSSSRRAPPRDRRTRR